MNYEAIDAKISRSSLGSKSAIVARSKVTRDTAAQIVARSQSATIAPKSSKKS